MKAPKPPIPADCPDEFLFSAGAAPKLKPAGLGVEEDAPPNEKLGAAVVLLSAGLPKLMPPADVGAAEFDAELALLPPKLKEPDVALAGFAPPNEKGLPLAAGVAGEPVAGAVPNPVLPAPAPKEKALPG